ncbi:hypothetical protein E1B28_010344 [Marasmius oreades]|uniref:Uncharacterized protein n=1 Tax=Marasmius oreades TaxID=181124 RepID=A0A9P7RXK1_9AGAR|nr:uncharacterized protein E1B28_010344 [Marasmius oreades]KAG7091298.1 hypothetical protein E1B28_010344 [Marasmius oreades]
MCHSSSNDTLFPIACQRRLQPTRPLTITVPVQDRLYVDLGPSFRGADLLRRSYTRSSHRRIMSPPVGSQFFDSDSDGTDDEWDTEDEAQYLTIPPDSLFYHHPTAWLLSSPVPGSSEGNFVSFACDAMSDEEEDIDRAAQMFHDELTRFAPGLGETKFDQDCLKELGSELITSPLRLFEDTFFQTLRKRDNSALPPVLAPENYPTSGEPDSHDEKDSLALEILKMTTNAPSITPF